MKRITVAAIIAIVLAAICGACRVSIPWLTASSQPVANLQPELPPEQLKADLDYLFKTIEEVHVNIYAYTSQEEFAGYRDALYRQIDRPMNQVEFYKLVAPVVAKLKNGHTMVFPSNDAFQAYLSGGGKVFPLEIRWDDDKLLIARNFGHSDVPLGGEILKIAGQDAAELLNRIASRFARETRSSSPQILQRQGLLAMQMWIESGAMDSAVLTIRGLDGQIKDYTVPFIGIAELIRAQERQVVKSDNWSFRLLEDHSAGLLKFNSCTEPDKLRTFLLNAFRQLRDNNIPNLIIDIRENPGGTSEACDVLLEFLIGKPSSQAQRCQTKMSEQFRQQRIMNDSPAGQSSQKPAGNQAITTFEAIDGRPRFELNPNRYKGRVFLLIGGNTGSSAVMLASIFKAAKLGTILGQETGDTLACYGEVLRFQMPNSKISFGVACKFFLLYGGKLDGHGVLPDREVRQTTADLAKGVDTVLEYALSLARAAQPAAASQAASQPAVSDAQE